MSSKKPDRILVVADDEDDIVLIQYHLEQSGPTAYELIMATGDDQAAGRLAQERFAACLVVHRHEEQDGLEFLRRFAGSQNAPPMILVTGQGGSEMGGQARKYGAADCLLRTDLSPQLLDRSLRYAISRHDYQQQLWHSREHYRKIVDNALDAITVIDNEGTIIEWNPQAGRLFGWRREEVIGRKLEETIILEPRIPIFRAWLAEALRSDQLPDDPRPIERTLRHKDGHQIPVLARVMCIADVTGVVFVTYYEDLTASQEMRETARRFETIVQSITDVMALLDRNYVYLAANDANLKAWGRDPRELVGRHVKEVLGEEMFKQRRPLYDRVLAGESLTDDLWMQLPRLGRRFWSVHYDPYRNAAGEIAGIVVHPRDLTDQKLAEEALSRSNRLIRTVVHLQEQYIRNVEPEEVFRQVLGDIIDLTGSEFGFIGEVCEDGRGAPYLKTYAITDISWNEETSALYRRIKDPGMEFHNLKTLYGAVITSHEPVISNDPAKDPRAGGLPPGHPPLTSFLGLPFIQGTEILGMLGLANRPGGYDEDMIHYLDAISAATAGIIAHWRSEQRLARAELRFQQLYDENPAMFFTVDKAGVILSVNKYALDQLGYEPADLIGHSVDNIFHPDDVDLAHRALMEIFAAHDSVRSWELRKLRKNGESLWVRETARISTLPGGEDVALIVCEDISTARALTEQLSYQATHDVLTDLVNRREFERRLKEAINSARFHGAEHVMCYIDLDQFKVVNDTCGHLAGDTLLRDLALTLSRKIRRRDTLARLGGDEFALLMEHCSLDEARHIIAGLHDIINDYQFSWQGRQYRIGSSIGVVPVNNESGDVHEVLRLADTACYAAKDTGRNAIHIHDAADESLKRRHGEMLWVERINHALEAGMFRLAYQSIVPARGPKRGEHYELLIRLLGDDGKLIPPGAFLPAAERYGAIGRLDRWVIATWFQWLREHPQAMNRLLLSSINLSAHSIGNQGMLAFIQTEAERHRVPPEKICFELTETAAIANLGRAVEFMTVLRQDGFKFALDDFGSGLSSFAYLRTLPVNYVKIDGVFVKNIVKNNIDRAMVRSINDVAHTMGKMTVAEFVEDEAALELLNEIGVDYAQGYGIGQPESIDKLLK